jgi:UDP-2,4-diacetamido-2,4,6-trideoxy-beta-L-altropyranose hydrolase
MNILVRCDSSNIIGTGHVMRCLNLCEYNPNNNYTFVCRNFFLNISDKIIDAGYKLLLLDYNIEPTINEYNTWIGTDINDELSDLKDILSKNNYDELIIDHYGIDFKIEKILKEYCKKLIVISDIFDFTHFCDEYINYNCDDIKKLSLLNLNPNTLIKCGVENIIINKKFYYFKK